MATIEEILNTVSDSAPTVVDIPGRHDETFRCKALLIKKESPVVELLFPPDSWEADALEIGAKCNLVVEHKKTSLNLIAHLDSIIDDRRLLMTVREPISPSVLRDFFRVAINTPIEASYISGFKEVKVQTWKMIGTTLDLSGSGVLALFAEKPASSYHIQLVISVPQEPTPIVCLASMVRSYRIRKNRHQVAFHFENISAKTRDQIISCCLQEQRRQLRENVQTA